ncbi:hypothetical protein HW132_34465 [Brasilonema sp. CT11]|nr:hypothetical protein [Brasilonema sp. CT11]
MMIDGMKSTELSIILSSYGVLRQLGSKYKFSAEQVKQIVEVAKRNGDEKDVLPWNLWQIISREASHAIDDQQLNYLTRVEEIEKGGGWFFITSGSYTHLRKVFRERLDKVSRTKFTCRY